jgi:hypothetical protein
MKIHSKIPVPVTFNPHKHHFGFLMEKIKSWKETDWQNVEEELRVIGTNLLDLYLGNLLVEEICKESIGYFNKKNISGPDEFKYWLKPSNYRKIELSDQSVWVVKEGVDRERYIHIHPAKDSPHCIRVRGTTLKTVLGLKIVEIWGTMEAYSDLEKVNLIRQKFLQLSPVKSLERGKGIARLWSFFNSP